MVYTTALNIYLLTNDVSKSLPKFEFIIHFVMFAKKICTQSLKIKLFVAHVHVGYLKVSVSIDELRQFTEFNLEVFS